MALRTVGATNLPGHDCRIPVWPKNSVLVRVQSGRSIPIGGQWGLEGVVAMPRTDDLHTLPENLPVPIDDGACDHLRDMRLPALPLRSTTGDWVDLAALQGRTVVYCYPRTGEPDVEGPPGCNE